MEFKTIQIHFLKTAGDNEEVKNCSQNNVELSLLIHCMGEQGNGGLDDPVGYYWDMNYHLASPSLHASCEHCHIL